MPSAKSSLPWATPSIWPSTWGWTIGAARSSCVWNWSRGGATRSSRPSVRRRPALVQGREVVDWRREADTPELLVRLRAAYGPDVALWAEGLDPKPEGALTRLEAWPHGTQQPWRSGRLRPAPPCCAMCWRTVAPRVLVLLPPAPLPETSPQAFVTQVLGMVRVALRRDEGRLDVARMAARLAARSEAIVASLRGLEAAGTIGAARELRRTEGEYI